MQNFVLILIYPASLVPGNLLGRSLSNSVGLPFAVCGVGICALVSRAVIGVVAFLEVGECISNVHWFSCSGWSGAKGGWDSNGD